MRSKQQDMGVIRKGGSREKLFTFITAVAQAAGVFGMSKAPSTAAGEMCATCKAKAETMIEEKAECSGGSCSLSK